jgi:hypothetical protein
VPKITRRLALSASCVAALMALYALSAQAASSPATATTGPATNVTAISAVLNGQVATNGQQTEWQFQYGKSTHYSKATPIQTIAAGGGTVNVSWKVTSLDPNTVYHFRLAAISGVGTRYYEINYGRDRTFRTKARGKFKLRSTHLTVTHGFVSAPLFCDSNLPCSGRYSIDTHSPLAKTHKSASIVCTTAFYRISPGKTKDVHGKIRPGCESLLRAAKNNTIQGRLSSAPRTGQRGLIEPVTLTGT